MQQNGKQKSSINQNIRLKFNQQSISIIPKISEPNKLLPKTYQFSRSIQHLFINNIQDIQSQPSKKQQIIYYYNDHNQNKLNSKSIDRSLSIKRKSIDFRFFQKVKCQRIVNLWNFFLENYQQIVFMSRTMLLLLQEKEKIIFRKLISYQQKQFNQNYQISYQQQYHKTLQKLVKIFNENHKFPYLCPEINQNISQNQSFQNILLKNQNSLSFNDNFQCSNILMVKYLENKNENLTPTYFISTRFDYQTSSYGQWFYFSVKRNHHNLNKQQKLNKSATFKYKFVICNMTKNFSMLGKQMKISVCRNGKWGKQGQNINYYQTCLQRRKRKIYNQNHLTTQLKINKNHQCFYALQFELQIQSGQQIYISYNQPYSVTRLSKLLNNFSQIFIEHRQTEIKLKKPKRILQQLQTSLTDKQNLFNSPKQTKVYFKRQIICQTILKNQIQCISFSMKNKKQLKFYQQLTNQDKSLNNQGQIQKKIIFIFARSHPIQTAGSYVIQGLMKNLFLFTEYQNDPKRYEQLKQYFKIQGKGKLIQNLLKRFIIKIIPMINPDGVILGNSRCNFHGIDLNRKWKKTDKNLTPEIYHIKKFLLKYKQKIQMVIDLHGHSKKRNVFAYGIHDFKDPFSTRQFPFLLSKLSKENFLFHECRFTRLSDLIYRSPSKQKDKQKISPNKATQNLKQGTARIWLYRKLNIPNIFTIQNSYCGSINSKYHYDSFSYNQIGNDILMGISLYFINYLQKQQKKQNNHQNKLIQRIQKDKIKNKSKNKYKKHQKFKYQQESSTIQTQTLNNAKQKMQNDIQCFKMFKQSLMMDLKSKQQNISIGMMQIDSSQSQQQQIINKKQIQNLNKDKSNCKQKSVSLKKNIIKSSKNLKLNQQKTEKRLLKENLKFRYSSKPIENNGQKSINQFQNSFKLNRNNTQRDNLDKYVPPEVKNKVLHFHNSGRKKQLNAQKIYKSSSNINKNTTVSVVQIGWNKNQIKNNNHHQSAQNYTNIINQSVNKLNQIIGTYNSSINNQKKMIIKKLQNKLNNQNQQQSSYNNLVVNKSRNLSQNYNTLQILQKLQSQKNINDFMKKIQMNKKLKSQLISNKKIDKYKQIISKINTKKNNDFYPFK